MALDLTNEGKTDEALNKLQEALQALCVAVQTAVINQVGEITVPRQVMISSITIPMIDTTTLKDHKYIMGMPQVNASVFEG
jgi:hypothetical protein